MLPWTFVLTGFVICTKYYSYTKLINIKRKSLIFKILIPIPYYFNFAKVEPWTKYHTMLIKISKLYIYFFSLKVNYAIPIFIDNHHCKQSERRAKNKTKKLRELDDEKEKK